METLLTLPLQEGERVLLVEDDLTIQKLLQSQLSARGWEIEVVRSGRLALERIAQHPPDLVLLDIGIEELDGLEVCRQVRQWSSIPIILVTAADTPRIKVTALELGADDYLTKPFHTAELVARMRAVLRRAQASAPPRAQAITIGPFVIDLLRREVKRSGEEIKLTKIEFDLLRELVLHVDHVLPYSHLLRAVWGENYDEVHVVHVHVSHLRRKLEPNITGDRYLLTVPGVGYRLRTDQL
ncbi:response regulator transcription factor [Armatimonas rosea]|uniref:Two-component system KDP operon response regulator KdpE n=1 Tax=Armatimonas rosea TaxID=685828 RepID=A0A7W9SS29_ARMRO|nr:response regulator transcription factor [Armatimonas rosea]MBB6051681.1 two-component system KDP operon response regulator KdpE [Armatimonas rosea]